jgi:tRNA threonylcarbamoyladenosine biosynthesis protein TsaB
MMRILGVDSSIPLGSIALLENNHIISETTLEDRANHSDGLLRAVDRVLSQARSSLDDVSGFGITTGPGSFTGLRVGVSLIKGFVLAREIPFKGIDTLEAVSACVEPTSHPICALLDARKKEVYCAFFKYQGNELKRLTPDKAITAEELCGSITEPTVFIGNGLDTYGEFLHRVLGSQFIDGSKTKKHTVAASAAILAKPFLTQDPSMDLDELKIKYVRKSEAEINLLKKNIKRRPEK